MTAVKDWVWDGHAAHLVVAQDCDFHLATRVGRYIVSTVGEYRSRGLGQPDGVGDYEGFSTIGLGRLFETYVFRAAEASGFGIEDWGEIDSLPANDHDTATANHLTMCRKYAKRRS